MSRDSTKRIVTLIAGIAAFAMAFFAAYWWLTDEERRLTEEQRVEYAAMDKLLDRVEIERKIRSFYETPRVVKLEDSKSWAKTRSYLRSVEWDFQPNNSTAFPFKAEIIIKLKTESSVWHESIKEAERDDELYSAGNSFYSEPIGYRSHNGQRRLVMHFLYDKSKKNWVYQKTEEEEP